MTWYMRAYPLAELKRFDGWDHEAADDVIVYLHQSLTVTKSAVKFEDVIFNQVTPTWETFCRTELSFAVPNWEAEAAEARRAASEPPV